MAKSNDKGITLVALVITIIVLIILATISINLVFGENGIIQKTQEGSNKYMQASAEEMLQTKIAEIDAKYYGEKLRRATSQEIIDELSDSDKIEYISTTSNPETKSKNIGDLDNYDGPLYIKFKDINSEIKIENITKDSYTINGITVNVSGDSEENNPNRIYLYYNGKQNVEFENKVANRTSDWATPSEAEMLEKSIRLYEITGDFSQWRSCGITTKEPIDLSNYSKLYVEYEVIEPTKGLRNGNTNYESLAIQASSGKPYDYGETLGANTSEKGKFTKCLDLRKVLGPCYIKVLTFTSRGDNTVYSSFDGDVRITKIWLEKYEEESNPGTMLYKNGRFYINWEAPVGRRSTSWAMSLSGEFNKDYIKLYEQAPDTSSWRLCGVVNSQPIDLTNYSKVNVEYEVIEPSKGKNNSGNSHNSMSIQVSNSKSLDYSNVSVSNSSTIGLKTATLNISNVTGNNYIKIYTFTAQGDGYKYSAFDQDIRIYKIWLE